MRELAWLRLVLVASSLAWRAARADWDSLNWGGRDGAREELWAGPLKDRGAALGGITLAGLRAVQGGTAVRGPGLGRGAGVQQGQDLVRPGGVRGSHQRGHAGQVGGVGVGTGGE